MDNRFQIPGIPIRFGLDAIIGLIPGVGDLSTALPGLFHFYVAYRLRAGVGVWLKLAAYLGIDLLIGSVPLLGDLFDVGFKGHMRCAALLQRVFDKRYPEVEAEEVVNVEVDDER